MYPLFQSFLVDFNIMVLSSNAWPFQPLGTINVPAEVSSLPMLHLYPCLRLEPHHHFCHPFSWKAVSKFSPSSTRLAMMAASWPGVISSVVVRLWLTTPKCDTRSRWVNPPLAFICTLHLKVNPFIFTCLCSILFLTLVHYRLDHLRKSSNSHFFFFRYPLIRWQFLCSSILLYPIPWARYNHWQILTPIC